MTVPLVLLAICSVCVAWGWPLWDVHASVLHGRLHHAQHLSVEAEFGKIPTLEEEQAELNVPEDRRENYWAMQWHGVVGNIVLGIALLGFVFAALLYYYRVLDPAEAKEQFPAVHRFLQNKWYFDELYSAILVRPALTVAHWCRSFDARVIDGFVDFLGRFTVKVARWDGQFDLGVIDGLVNVVGRAIYGIGGLLRGVQTGYLRSYILFLVLAVIGIYVILSYYVSLAAAG